RERIARSVHALLAGVSGVAGVLEGALARGGRVSVLAGGAVHVREQAPRLREAGVVVLGSEDLDRLLDRRDGRVAPALVCTGSQLEQQASQAGVRGEPRIAVLLGGGGRL